MSGSPYKVVDIFAGPGGLGEGFVSLVQDNGKTVFKIALSIEKDPSAHSTLLLRSFYRQFPAGHAPKEYWDYIKGNIEKADLFRRYQKQAQSAFIEAQCLELGITPRNEIKSIINHRLNGTKKWVLVGGPPCQAYSCVGRSRMRSTNAEFEKDKRHFLYKEYLQILADHKPPVFVMENVRGMLSAEHSGEKIIWKILDDLRSPEKATKGGGAGVGYRLFSLVDKKTPDQCMPEDFLVKSEQFGIPQARHRVLILGIRKDIKTTPEILKPSEKATAWQVIADLPKIRSAVSKETDSLDLWREILKGVTDYSWFNKGKENGLSPVIRYIEKSLVVIGRRDLQLGAEFLSYNKSPARHAKWYQHGCEGMVLNHTARSHIRGDLHRYLFASSFAAINDRSINLGDLPQALLPNHQNVKKSLLKNHFSDRFRVQLRNLPSSTVTSHISKDGHYFIHCDPTQCRSLSVREAARLQTFPDSYKFEGNRTSQYHQVGNAVPPLLSFQIAQIVSEILRSLRD